MQDTGKFRKNTKDQYYTKSSIAKHCVEKLLDYCPQYATYQWIEPSAGNGVFLCQLSDTIDKLGIDIEPKSPEIIKHDFLEWTPTLHKKRIFFGNPPFGRQGSLAKSFIKHSAKYGEFIAFILPRSFVKPSMSSAFPMKFHCIHSEELQKNAFQVNDKEYDVPCVFQIWEKKLNDRILPEKHIESGFQYVKNNDEFHIAFKRVGGLAGKCYAHGIYNPQFHYFLKLEDIYLPHSLSIIETVNKHVFPSNTVGPRSLSKSEANEVLNRVLSEYST